MTYAGIDPGQTGALVEIGADGHTVVRWVEWRRERVPPDGVLADLSAEVVAVEAPYVGPGARASLTLAEWTGRLLAQMPAGPTVVRPTAAQWRPKVLRASPGRVEAKALALRAAASCGLVGVSDHVAEAWCLARYAWGWDQAGRPEVTRG